MSRIRLTSDLHFQHPLVAKLRGFTKLDDRNLAGTPDGKPDLIGDTEAHDGVITENFNKGTRDDDLTIIAGDFAMNWKGAEAKLSRLRGRIILIEGNHDIMSCIHKDGWKYRAAWTGEGKFEAIVAYMRRKTRHGEYLISHYPYTGDHTGTDRLTQYRLRDEGMWLAHGHTHSKEKFDEQSIKYYNSLSRAVGFPLEHPGRQVHIGLDAWDLHPVREEDVIDLMKSLDWERGKEQG